MRFVYPYDNAQSFGEFAVGSGWECSHFGPSIPNPAFSGELTGYISYILSRQLLLCEIGHASYME